ncbi:MAG: hypothetical protein ACTSUE_17305 [Promethearchaeota archaeon]
MLTSTRVPDQKKKEEAISTKTKKTNKSISRCIIKEDNVLAPKGNKILFHLEVWQILEVEEEYERQGVVGCPEVVGKEEVFHGIVLKNVVTLNHNSTQEVEYGIKWMDTLAHLDPHHQRQNMQEMEEGSGRNAVDHSLEVREDNTLHILLLNVPR